MANIYISITNHHPFKSHVHPLHQLHDIVTYAHTQASKRLFNEVAHIPTYINKKRSRLVQTHIIHMQKN
jgi:hypothetical protein